MSKKVISASDVGKENDVSHFKRRKSDDFIKQVILAQEKAFLRKNTIKTGIELGEFIDAAYKCDQESKEIILERTSISEIVDLTQSNDDFLQRAAENLSYLSIVFLIDLGQASFFRSKFTKESPILKKFIENLKVMETNKHKGKQILTALMYFNPREVEDAVIDCRDRKLIKLLLAAKQEISSSEKSKSY